MALVDRHERSIMVARVIGFACSLLDHEALRSAMLSRHRRVHVILPIPPSDQSSFTILEGSPADIARRRIPLQALDLSEDLKDLVRNLRDRSISLLSSENAGASAGGDVAASHPDTPTPERPIAIATTASTSQPLAPAVDVSANDLIMGRKKRRHRITGLR